MFRPIRRKKKEMDIDAAKELLQRSRRGVLAVNGDDGYPYAVPVNYFYDSDAGKIYFHGARTGHQSRCLESQRQGMLHRFTEETVKEEAWAPFVQSTVVFGRCHLLEEGTEATEILKKIARKYYPNEQLIDEEIERSGKAVQLLR